MTKSDKPYALGVDYGTSSCRAVIVDVRNGKTLAEADYAYPSGTDGVITDAKDPNLARQNPADYIKAFEQTVTAALAAAGERRKSFSPEQIVGIGTDATGSTPIPLDETGKPLASLKEFKKNPDAFAWLWKDHTAHEEAAEITAKADDAREDYLAKCGGGYSSEWFWSKILRCKRNSPAVSGAAATWVEQSDFVPGYLTGNLASDSIVRNLCAAGHKGMYHADWGGWPKQGFLASLAPELARLGETLGEPVSADQPAGMLDAKVARKVGLPAGIPVAAGVIDAHAGAVGAGIRPGTLCKIIGTSTCDMMVVPADKDLVDIPGVCGLADSSIVPGTVGIEAGQSAVGDLFNWAATQLAPESYTKKGNAHAALTREAEKLKPGESGLLALDWNNGNRTVLIDPLLTGLLVGQTLHTTAAEIYRALIEATAFGALTIIRRFEQYGVKVKDVINCGGIAEKSPLVMQIYADVCNRPMKVSRSPQTCALGAAIFGSVVGGAHKSLEAAQKQMTGVKETVYRPRKHAAETYAKLYELYMQLHDAFGTPDFKGDLHLVMKKLIDIRANAR